MRRCVTTMSSAQLLEEPLSLRYSGHLETQSYCRASAELLDAGVCLHLLLEQPSSCNRIPVESLKAFSAEVRPMRN